MKCISLHQPWAQWVVAGLKTIETRTHNRFASLKGQRIAIHASMRFNLDAVETALKYAPKQRYKLAAVHTIYPGKIIGTVQVLDSRVLTFADSFDALCDAHDLYGLILVDPKSLGYPVLWPGQRGIFHVPNELFIGR